MYSAGFLCGLSAVFPTGLVSPEGKNCHFLFVPQQICYIALPK